MISIRRHSRVGGNPATENEFVIKKLGPRLRGDDDMSGKQMTKSKLALKQTEWIDSDDAPH